MKKILIFIAGAAIGSGATYFVMKKKFDQELNEIVSQNLEKPEIEFEEKEEAVSIDEEEEDFMNSDKPIPRWTPKSESLKSNYRAFVRKPPLRTSDDDVDQRFPVIISPEEFGEDETFEVETLHWYQDERLADTAMFLIDDIEGTVGVEALETFGQYEEDSVFVKNYRFNTYYEILKVKFDYTEALAYSIGNPEGELYDR